MAGDVSLVADTLPGTGSGLTGAAELVSFANRVWFRASTDGTSSGARLWSSDGTPGGTTAWPEVLSPSGIVAAPSALYVIAPTSSSSPQYLQSIDVQGTRRVLDLGAVPGLAEAVTVVPTGPLVSFGDGVAFAGLSETQRARSCGWPMQRASGCWSTPPPVEVFPGAGVAASSEPYLLAAANGSVYATFRNVVEGRPPKVRPFTTQSLVQVLPTRPWDVAPGPGGLLAFTGDDLVLLDDGDGARPLAPAGVTPAGMGAWRASSILFPATDAEHGTELWRSDGQAGNAVLVADIAPGTAASSPADPRAGRDPPVLHGL